MAIDTMDKLVAALPGQHRHLFKASQSPPPAPGTRCGDGATARQDRAVDYPGALTMGGPWPYIAAAARPGKVKAILDLKGMSPFGAPWNASANSLKGVPVICVQAEKSSIKIDAMVKALKDGGCYVEALHLKDKGVLGNGQFMMFENNRKQVFDTIQKTLEAKVKV